MDSANSPLTPYAQNLQQGMREANRAMVVKAAAFGRTLVLGQSDGTWVERDARLILENDNKE